MRCLLTVCFVLGAQSATAESLCDWSDETRIFNELVGEWSYVGARSVESETFSRVIETTGPAEVFTNGTFEAWDATIAFGFPPVALETGSIVYDVDQIDDLLETAEALWIADDVSQTPCGPENLPQLTATFGLEGLVEGQVTLVPYFTNAVVMIVEAELPTQTGLAFLTTAALSTRE